MLLEGADPAKKRKTPYSLVTVYKGENPINIDSQAPNQLAAEYFDGAPYLNGFGKITSYEREVKHGDSRFDFYLKGTEGEGFLEVKGVTLEEDGLAKFPTRLLYAARSIFANSATWPRKENAVAFYSWCR